MGHIGLAVSSLGSCRADLVCSRHRVAVAPRTISKFGHHAAGLVRHRFGVRGAAGAVNRKHYPVGSLAGPAIPPKTSMHTEADMNMVLQRTHIEGLETK